MIEFYSQIKWVHIAAVIASGLLFLLRGVAVEAGARWPMAESVRWLSVAIDSILLTAALMLVSILHQYPFVQAWLTAKICLVVVYIGLGTIALRRGRTPRTRLVFLIAALVVYAFIISVAIAHHPLGAFFLLKN